MIHFFRNKIGTTKIPAHTQEFLIDQNSNLSAQREILVGAKSMVKYLIIWTQSKSKIIVKTTGEASDIKIFGIFFGTQAKADIQVQIDHAHTQVQVHLISFLQDKSAIDVNGNISISSWITKVVAGLLQENIILGDHIHIQAKPMLTISSNDVQASHGAKIERIDSEKLLYMTSRGLTPQQAQRLVIQWYFTHISDQMSWGMSEKEAKEFSSLLDDIQQKILP